MINNSVNRKASKRIAYFDTLRAIACIMVVFIHVGVVYYNKNFGSFNFWVGDVFVSLSRVAVPLFVMISGALMLDKDYTFTWKKMAGHIGKMALFFYFWSFVSCFAFEIAMPILKHRPLNFYKIFTEIVEGPYHLWFIYMIIGLYLLVPILRLFVRAENKKIIEYFLILSLVFAFLFGEMVRIGTNFSDVFVFLDNHFFGQLGMQFVGGYTAYFILGWYLHNFEIANKKLLYGLGIAGFLYTAISSYFFSILAGKAVLSDSNLSVNVLLQSVAVFVYFKSKDSKDRADGKAPSKIVTFVAKHSLGVYAMHVMVFTTLLDVFAKIGLTNALIAIPANVVVSFAISLFASYVLSKIPLIKKVV